jgi:hypothetical protein
MASAIFEEVVGAISETDNSADMALTTSLAVDAAAMNLRDEIEDFLRKVAIWRREHLLSVAGNHSRDLSGRRGDRTGQQQRSTIRLSRPVARAAVDLVAMPRAPQMRPRGD